MLGLILAIAGAVALGCLIAWVVALTIKVLYRKIRELLSKRNVKKVAAVDLQAMIDNCSNTTSLSALEALADEGTTHLMAEVDRNGQIVDDVTAVKDLNEGAEVDDLINRTGEGMVVVEG